MRLSTCTEHKIILYRFMRGFPGGSDGEEAACNSGDLGLIPVLGRSPGEGHGDPLQYSCLGNFYGQRSLAGYSPSGCRVGHDWTANTRKSKIPFYMRLTHPQILVSAGDSHRSWGMTVKSVWKYFLEQSWVCGILLLVGSLYARNSQLKMDGILMTKKLWML